MSSFQQVYSVKCFPGHFLRLAGREQVPLTPPAGCSIETVIAYESVPLPLPGEVAERLGGGALVLRTGMVFGGTWLLSHFTVLAYVFGAVLIATGGKMLLRPEKQPHPERGRAFRLLSRVIPTTGRPAEGHLFLREDGRLKATSLFLVLVLIELSDIVFAIDSILAIFAVTSDPFIVLTSNVFAIMGMRSLYFLLAGQPPSDVHQQRVEDVVVGVVVVGDRLDPRPAGEVEEGIRLVVRHRRR